MKKSGPETVNVAPEIFRLIVQSFRRDVVRGTPNFATCFSCYSSQSEIADLGHVFVGKKNVGRLHVAMNQAFSICRAQAFGGLNARLQHLLFRQTGMLFDEIVET